jgi:RNA polymerase primary sigma factor
LIAPGARLGVLAYPGAAGACVEPGVEEAELEEPEGQPERLDVELAREPDLAVAAGANGGTAGERREVILEPGSDGTTDALRLLFRDIARLQPLDAEREVELARQIWRGDLDAKQKLVEANLRLVVIGA